MVEIITKEFILMAGTVDGVSGGHSMVPFPRLPQHWTVKNMALGVGRGPAPCVSSPSISAAQG